MLSNDIVSYWDCSLLVNYWALGARDMILAGSGRQYSAQNLFLYQFVNTNPTRTGLGSDTDIRIERSVTIILSLQWKYYWRVLFIVWISREKYGFS
jgi:hypothetical protein